MGRRSTPEGAVDRPARRRYARVVVAGRWVVVAVWVALAGAAYLQLPPLAASANGGGLVQFLPDHSRALSVEREAGREFGFPLSAQTMLVQRDAGGLGAATQVRTVRAAVAVDRHRARNLDGLTGAVPILNTAGLLPFTRERSTTAVTYLAFSPDTSLVERDRLAHRYADEYLGSLPQHGSVVGVTGTTIGRLAQGQLINDRLAWVELAGILMVILVVGWEFRSVLAPAVTIVAAVAAYVVSARVVGWGGQALGIAVPSELEPLIVVLLLGVVTDYSVFFLNGTRNGLRAGDEPKAAVRHAVVTNSTWVVGAGTAVAAGTAVLYFARLDIFHALGPGLAVTVLVALAVSVTLVPALLAILGRTAFWPQSRRARRPSRSRGLDDGRRAAPRAMLLSALVRRPVAALVVVVLAVGLGAAAWQVRRLDMGLSTLGGLPADTEPARAEAAAAAGFAPGVLNPTTVLVRGADVATQRSSLARLQQLIGKQPGVAGVVGPGSLPTPGKAGIFLASDRDAARYAVVLDSPPLEDAAIDDVSRLRSRLPSLAHEAGLRSVTTGVGGGTALAADIVDTVQADMVRVGGLALLVELVVLLVFLRSALAPVYLLIADALSLTATLGITTVVLARLLDYPQWTFYVPFAVVILLVSFGSDYEIFLVGRIWETAERRALRAAVVESGTRASRAISIAGVALALSFATLALVPLHAFREFALAMLVGVLLDVFVVRQLLVPALITLFGRTGAWPRRVGSRRPTAPAGPGVPLRK